MKGGKPLGLKNALFDYDVGSIFFCKDTQKTPFDPNGVGISLYFIFIKTLMVFLFLASLASIYLIVVNASGMKK